MNRSLVTFLCFVAVLIGAFAAVAWWAGPTLVSLVVDEERRTSPFYLLHLLGGDDPGEYFQRFGALLREEEAQLLWRGGLKSLRAGRSRDEFADVAIVEFQAGGDVVQLLTSSAFRDLSSTARPVLLGTAEPPGPIAQDETVLLWLFESESDAEILEGFVETAVDFGGQLVWSATVGVLQGDRAWNHLLMVAFPDAAALDAWLTDPGTVTDLALNRRYYDEAVMLELGVD